MAGLRRPEKALSAQFVRTTRDPGKYFDGHGLYLRVDANGSRFWVQRIVIRGKRCELGLGSPALVTLSEAREMALANRKLARAGGDPLQAKREALGGADVRGSGARGSSDPRTHLAQSEACGAVPDHA